MEFSSLYSDELTERLGSDDTQELFTTARRKDAINKAQEWFITRTGCLWKTATISLVDEVAEYDLETLISDETLITIAAQSPVIKIVRSTGNIEYIAGPDSFPRRTEDWLDQEDPGWRSDEASTPNAWYLRQEGAAMRFGITPAASIASGDTWTAQIPYVVQADEMTDDTDEPFTLDSVIKVSLRPWHTFLADYAAHKLEKLRKGLERSTFFMAAAEAGAKSYLDSIRTPGSGKVMLQKRYFKGMREAEPFGARFGRWWG